MSYPDGMTTEALDRNNGRDELSRRETDYQIAKQARAILNTAHNGLAELAARDSVLAWAITDAMTALEKSVDQVNGAEPEMDA
jgi:uncharacterized membrane protein